jgi:hypothetical protein
VRLHVRVEVPGKRPDPGGRVLHFAAHDRGNGAQDQGSIVAQADAALARASPAIFARKSRRIIRVKRRLGAEPRHTSNR